MKSDICGNDIIDIFAQEVVFSLISDPLIPCIIIADTDKNISDIYKRIVSKICADEDIQITRKGHKTLTVEVRVPKSNWGGIIYSVDTWFLLKHEFNPPKIQSKTYNLHTYGISNLEIIKNMGLEFVIPHKGEINGNTLQL